MNYEPTKKEIVYNLVKDYIGATKEPIRKTLSFSKGMIEGIGALTIPYLVTRVSKESEGSRINGQFTGLGTVFVTSGMSLLSAVDSLRSDNNLRNLLGLPDWVDYLWMVPVSNAILSGAFYFGPKIAKSGYSLLTSEFNRKRGELIQKYEQEHHLEKCIGETLSQARDDNPKKSLDEICKIESLKNVK